MATAVLAAAPLIAGGSAAAGATTATIAGISLSKVVAGISLASTVFKGFQSFQQTKAAGKAEQLASEQRAREYRLQAQQERTQKALLDAERQRNLRRQLASQRAMAGGRVDFSGNILNLQGETISEANRAARLAANKSNFEQSQLNRQALSEQRAGYNSRVASINKANTSLISTAVDSFTKYEEFKGTL